LLISRWALTILVLGNAVSRSQDASPERGQCSLEQALPVTVMQVDSAFEMLLDDGRRIVLSALDFPQYGPDAPGFREKALERLTVWLVGRQIFFAGLVSAPDRWGRIPSWAFGAAPTFLWLTPQSQTFFAIAKA
jgi:hypothetical protein